MSYYETMYIAHPALEAGRLKDLILSVEKTIKNVGGETLAFNIWGKKKLAYPINKEKYGVYILFQFHNDGSQNKGFNLSLEHNSNILAHLTTKINKEDILNDMPVLDEQLGLLNPKKDDSNQKDSVKIENKKENI